MAKWYARVNGRRTDEGRTLEPLLRAQVDLLCLRDLLEDLLDHYSVIVSDLAGKSV